MTANSAAAKELTTANLEFTWRYYARLVCLLFPRYRRRMWGHTEVSGYQGLSHALEEGSGALLVSAHLGELEIAANWLTGVTGHEIVAVVDTVSPRWRQLFFDTVRRACGVRLRRQDDVKMEELVGDLAAGRIVLLMLDRRCRSAEVLVSFLGRPASLSSAAWALSQRTGAPVITGTTTRTVDGGCAVRFGSVCEPGPSCADLIQTLASELESQIRRAPSQWHVPADLSQLSCRLSIEAPAQGAGKQSHSSAFPGRVPRVSQSVSAARRAI